MSKTRAVIGSTLLALAVGALGAGIGWALSFPVFVITGPALAVSLTVLLTGWRMDLAVPLRDAAFLVVGIGIGAGVNDAARAAFLRWPLAFAVLGLSLAVTLWACRWVLPRHYGFDRRSAVLAGAPGHLSFVLSLGTDGGADLTRIAIVQSVRLLVLTFLVPIMALALGITLPGTVLPPGTPMATGHIVGLLAGAVALGFMARRLRTPAPFLLAGLGLSALTQVTGLTPGVLPPALIVPGFLIMGTLIGSRFTGITPVQLRRALGAGLTATVLATVISTAAAVPVAAWLGVPVIHVLVAFAPGGIETMIAMGAVLGADPGFTAAAHVARLFLLTVLIPLVIARPSSWFKYPGG